MDFAVALKKQKKKQKTKNKQTKDNQKAKPKMAGKILLENVNNI